MMDDEEQVVGRDTYDGWGGAGDGWVVGLIKKVGQGMDGDMSVMSR